MAVSSTTRSRSSPDIFISIQRKKKKKKKSSHSKTIGSQRRTESMVVTVRLYFWAIFSLAFSIKAVRQIKTLPGFFLFPLSAFLALDHGAWAVPPVGVGGDGQRETPTTKESNGSLTGSGTADRYTRVSTLCLCVCFCVRLGEGLVEPTYLVLPFGGSGSGGWPSRPTSSLIRSVSKIPAE